MTQFNLAILRFLEMNEQPSPKARRRTYWTMTAATVAFFMADLVGRWLWDGSTHEVARISELVLPVYLDLLCTLVLVGSLSNLLRAMMPLLRRNLPTQPRAV